MKINIKDISINASEMRVISETITKIKDVTSRDYRYVGEKDIIVVDEVKERLTAKLLDHITEYHFDELLEKIDIESVAKIVRNELIKRNL